MSSAHARDPSTTGSGPDQAVKRLACTLCSHRKVKCDRAFPCGNCVKAGAECIPSTNPRQRKKRFAERELLNRLRHYESLLREHQVAFEPMHSESVPSVEDSGDRRQLFTPAASASYSPGQPSQQGLAPKSEAV
jgi:hypothetical protein